jgi:hypothetical protein
MTAHPSDKYKALMNYMRNDLKITKEDIRQWTQQSVEDVAERYVEKNFTTDFVRSVVKSELDKIIATKEFSWWESEDNLDDYVKKQVVTKLLDGVHLKVDIVGSRKKATPTGQVMTVKRRIRKL